MIRVPVQPDQGQARDWAVQELSRREYEDARPGLVERALHWFWDLLDGVSFGAGPAPVLALLILAAVVGLVVTFAIRRSGGLHRTARRRAATVLPATMTTAADHRAAADRHARAEAWDQAVVEQFRAVARELEERALLSPQPGRTALEVARDGGAARPDLTTGLLAAARSFDEVSYGRLTVGRAAYLSVRELDDQLQTPAVAGR
jgi:hypothetical protein